MLAALITGAAALHAPFSAAQQLRSTCCRMELPFTLVDGWRRIIDDAQHAATTDFSLFAVTCRKLIDLGRRQ